MALPDDARCCARRRRAVIIQTTPSMAWLRRAEAAKAASPAPITPYGAYLSLRRPLLNAVEAAEAAKSAAVEADLAIYLAASAAHKAARVELANFNRAHRAPHAKAQWRDIAADDPLIRAIFG